MKQTQIDKLDHFMRAQNLEKAHDNALGLASNIVLKLIEAGKLSTLDEAVDEVISGQSKLANAFEATLGVLRARQEEDALNEPQDQTNPQVPVALPTTLPEAKEALASS